MAANDDAMKKLQQDVEQLKTGQATQAAALAGAQTTQAAAQAGTWATMIAGAAGLIVGIFLGLAISKGAAS